MSNTVLLEDAPAARHEAVRFKDKGNASAVRLYSSLARSAEKALGLLGVDLSLHIYANCLYLMDSIEKIRAEGKTRAADGIEHIVYNCQSEGTCPCRKSCMKYMPTLRETHETGSPEIYKERLRVVY